MTVSRMIRDVSAAFFLAVVLAVPRPGVSADGAECAVPGVVGIGGTEAEAIADCVDYGHWNCSGMCRTMGCGTDVWTPPAVCNQTSQGGSGWTALGYCKCGYWPE